MGQFEYYILMTLLSIVGLFFISIVVYIEINDRKAAKVNQLEKI